MAVTITRTPWQDDDGSGTTGTVINNAEKTAIYNQIDTALAQLAQLSGGNTFTGNQSINGVLSINSPGPHVFQSTAVSQVQIIQTSPGTGNVAVLNLGNDTYSLMSQLACYSSAYTASGFAVPNGTLLSNAGAGGLTLAAIHSAGPLKLAAGGIERLRVASSGEVLINSTANPASALLYLAYDTAARGVNGICVQNIGTGANANFAVFSSNSATAGTITQTSANTVAYNTSSDVRLKTDKGRATDLNALRAVVIHDFDWPDGSPDRGVFAQEAHPVFPRAITAGTDDLTDGGDLARPWMTDYSKFVSDLIVGWQQHDAKIAELRAELLALKGQH